MVKCTTAGGQCIFTDIDNRSREVAEFCNRSKLNQLSEAVLRWQSRSDTQVCRGLMIDGIEPAKCVQLAIDKCQKIQPILRIAIRAFSVLRRRPRNLFRTAARSRRCCFLFAPTAFAKLLYCLSRRSSPHVVVRLSFVS